MADDDVAIRVENVSKSFILPHEKQTSVKGMFVNIFNKNRSYEKQKVLNNISLEIKKGEFFGIVGRNGSGKSTLLKLLAGIYSPDKGNIQIYGSLTPFIELGVGFNPELTGRENIFLNGALLGFNRKEMNAMYDEIAEFAELENFMDQKLKNYSSGMQVRLAFSIAIKAKGDILLLDEVLAVGDVLFQKKCYDYFKQLKRDKKTVIFVSHDSSALLEYCDQGVLLEQGNIIHQGEIGRIVNEYTDLINDHEEETKRYLIENKEKKRWGSGQIIVHKTETYSAKGRQKQIFDDEEKIIEIRTVYKAKENIKKPVFGITILDSEGQRVFTSNTLWLKKKTLDQHQDQKTCLIWRIPNVFNTGTFSVSPAAADTTGLIIYDWVDDACTFKVRKKTHSIAYINTEHEVLVL